MSLLAVLVLMVWVQARAVLDQGGHGMLVTYEIQQPTKAQAITSVDIWFHVKGQSYRVATHRYPVPVTSIQDTFPWFSRSKWQGGDLEVVFHGLDGSQISRYIPEHALQVQDLRNLFPSVREKPRHYVNWSKVKSYEGPDPYAWRMLGYDPGHTGYYPFRLYPPLKFKWVLDEWGHPGSWITEVSGAAGHGMLFIPKSLSQWNIITARDIETGEILWERYVTANAWTSILSVGDSVLFVGTSIGYTPWKDTTFYALDPFTGELKWGKVFKTVEYSPVVVESLVYAPSLGLPAKLGCWNYSGDSIWTTISWMSEVSPAYYDHIIFHTGKDTLQNIYEEDSIVYARNYFTGELIWDFVEDNAIYSLTIYQNKVLVGIYGDILAHALDAITGGLVWMNNETFFQIPHGEYGKIYWGHGIRINGKHMTVFKWLNADDGQNLEQIFLAPSDTNGGRMLRMLVTEDSLLWVANVDMLYLLKVDQETPFDTLIFPQSPARFASWGFPIAYKNYYIYAHEDFLVVYAADTVRDTSEDGDTLVNFRIYPVYANGYPILQLGIPEGGWMKLTLFSVNGRRVWGRRVYLDKGTLFIPLPLLPSGIYSLLYDFREYQGRTKVFILKNRR